MGGGGLISGTYLATCLFSQTAKVIAAEPSEANDAFQYCHSGKAHQFKNIPKTLADNARTLRILERTFAYIKKLDHFYQIKEQEIIYWTQWLRHLLKVVVKPTLALGMAAAYQWIKEGNENKKFPFFFQVGMWIQKLTHKPGKKTFISNVIFMT